MYQNQQQGGGFNPMQQQAAPAQQQPQTNPAFVQGNQAQAAMQQAMAKQEALGNRTFRFSIKWLQNQQQPEHLITFLDGDLTQDGFLNCLCLNEHRVVIDGKPTQVTCTEPREPCPVCKAAEEQNNRNYNRAAFTGFLTVIDHTGYVDSQGVHHRDIIRLYAAKTKQMQLLIKMAQQYGTLRGVSFKVSRSSDKAAGVGDIMIPQGQADLNQLAQWWAQTYQDRGQLAPLDYNKELPYYDAAKLSQMCGFGMSHGQFGGGSQMPAYNPQQQYGAPQQPQQQPAYQPPQMAAQQPVQQQPMQQNQMPQYQNQPQQQAYNPAQQQPAQQQYQPPVQQQAPVQNQQPAYNPAQQAPAQQQAPIQQQPAQQQVPDHAPGLEPQNPMQQYQQNAPAQQQQQAPVQQQQAPVQQQNMAGTNPDYSGQL